MKFLHLFILNNRQINRLFIFLSLFCLVGAQIGCGSEFSPIDSERHHAEKFAALLDNELSLKSVIKKRNGNGATVVTIFTATDDRPSIVAYVNTRALYQTESGEPKVRMIGITSIADLGRFSGQTDQLLRWSNAWNDNALPIRVRVKNGSVIAESILRSSIETPVTDELFISSFVQTIESWVAIVRNLKENNLLTFFENGQKLNFNAFIQGPRRSRGPSPQGD